jgi:N-acetyl sugar amidotransferase
MKFCTNCLEPDTRPGSKFSKDGLCLTCEYYYHFTKQYDNEERIEIINKIIKKNNKDKTNNDFDCILGVSGGKDSVRQALWVREKLNLKPLLVCCAYPPEQLTDLGAKNLSNLIELGFDLLVTAPGPQTWKKFLKQGFINGNYLRGPELALYSSLPQIAIKYKINLIFWGEGGNGKTTDLKILNKNKEYDGNSQRKTNTLKNCDVSWMHEFIDDEAKLIPYIYPSEKEFKLNNIKIIYIGWFMKDWSAVNNAKYSSLNGLELRKDDVSKTADLFGATALDEDFVVINQMIKYYKFGFGRVTDYLNYEIRDKKISRDLAKKIIEKYDGACDDKYIKNFCEYIDINKDEFWNIVSNFVNGDLFTINNKSTGKKFLPKFKVGEGL